MRLKFSWQIFEKYSNIKFHENPSSGSRVVPWGRTDRQTDMTKLIVAFRLKADAVSPLYLSYCHASGQILRATTWHRAAMFELRHEQFDTVPVITWHENN